MTRWEYQTVIAIGGKEHQGCFILSINGDKEAAILQKAHGVYSATYVPLDSYLKSAGQEGWEVVGMAPRNSTGDSRGTLELLIILKRPLA